MSTLFITFNPPFPVPVQYKIRYKESTAISFTELIVPTTGLSPEEFSITGLTSGVTYDVEVQSYCGEGVYAAGNEVQSDANDCQSYSFSNSSGVDQDLEYILCSDPTNTIITTINNGGVEGPFCLSNGFGGPYTNPEGGLTVTTGLPCTP
jgi:hypothetical protein